MSEYPPNSSLSVVAVLMALAVGGDAFGEVTQAMPALLTRSCGECHTGGADEGGIALDKLMSVGLKAGDAHHEVSRAAWVAVLRNLRAETMPPADEPQPTAEERKQLVAWVLGDVLGVDANRPDPGHVVLRRLNRNEYANTVRDLTGIPDNLTDDLPSDDTGHGFDTNAAALSVSPMLLEKYLALATRIGQGVVSAAVLIGEPGGKRNYPKPLRRLFPYGPPPDDASAAHEHLRRTISTLAARGFRRPADDATVARLLAIADGAATAQGGTFEKAVAAALTAVLASPRFLFRVEEEDAGDAAATEAAVFVDEYALGSRLSYFLWSTMPDDELFKLAAAGRLRAELRGQVERMIRDRRSDAFVKNFVGQWLKTRDVDAVPVDIVAILKAKRWEDAVAVFSDDVRRAMRKETELFFGHMLKEGLPATDLLIARKTFVNEPLARFYGISGVTGPEMRLVDIPEGVPRGGLFTHGSFLLVTSNPTRTSPVKRGLFILENLLGTPPPPAPADVPALDKTASTLGADSSMRAIMEMHRRDPLCASCHNRMDPLGLALERYSPLGQWRKDEAAATLDTSGRLVTGERFSDARELAAVIAGSRRHDFYGCLAEKLLTYALGRGVEYFDGPAVDMILNEVEKNDRLETFVMAVVESVPFQMRRRASSSHVAEEHAASSVENLP